jgi:hypothetical protein
MTVSDGPDTEPLSGGRRTRRGLQRQAAKEESVAQTAATPPDTSPSVNDAIAEALSAPVAKPAEAAAKPVIDGKPAAEAAAAAAAATTAAAATNGAAALKQHRSFRQVVTRYGKESPQDPQPEPSKSAPANSGTASSGAAGSGPPKPGPAKSGPTKPGQVKSGPTKPGPPSKDWNRPDDSITVSSAGRGQGGVRELARLRPAQRRGALAALAAVFVIAFGILIWQFGTAPTPAGHLAGVHTPPPASSTTVATVARPRHHQRRVVGHKAKPKSHPKPPPPPTTTSTSTTVPASAGTGTGSGSGTGAGAGSGTGNPPGTKPPTKKPAPPPANGLLTTATAQQAFDKTWTPFAEAANAGNTAALSQLATSSVISVVTANRLCLCGQLPVSFTGVRLTSPIEHTYPLSFAAEIDGALTSHGPITLVAVLEKASATSTWQVGWLVKYKGTTPTLPARSTVGSRLPLVVAGALTTPIRMLGQLFQSLRSTGNDVPGNIWAGDLSDTRTEPARTASRLVAEHLAATSNHRSDAVSYWATDFSPIFASVSGYLACGQIEGVVYETPARGSVLPQPANRSNYGPTLAPGRYSAVTEKEARDFCINVSLADVVYPTGLTGGLFLAIGTRT